MKARYLRQAVVDQLFDEVPANLGSYRSGTFAHLLHDPALFFEGTFEVKEAVLSQLRPPEGQELFDAENCALCLNALTDATPYEARDERLWTYITHTYALEYTRARWQIPDDDGKAVSAVRTHFFGKGARGIDRDNSVSRLWWMGHLCNRVSTLPIGDSLKVLLHMSDVRANIIERPTISQNGQIFQAIIHALKRSFDSDMLIFQRAVFRPLMVSLNSVGGYRLLDCMSGSETEDLLRTLLQDATQQKPQGKTADTRTEMSAHDRKASSTPKRQTKPHKHKSKANKRKQRKRRRQAATAGVPRGHSAARSAGH